MKKITFIAFALFSSVAFVSCDKDDDNSSEVQPKDALIGKWDLNLFDIKISVDGNVVQEQKDIDLSGELKMQFDFKEDKTVHLYQYVEATDEEEEQEYNGYGTYVKNGNDLTINVDDEPQTFKIILNNQSDLHLNLSVSETYEGMLIEQESTFKMIKM